TGKPLGLLLRHGKQVRAAAFSPDGTRFLTLSDSGTVRWWDTATGKGLGVAKAEVAVFSPDGKALLTGEAGAAHLWEADRGRPLGLMLRRRGPPGAVGFSPDGKLALTASRHEHLDRFEIRPWRVETGEQLGSPLRQEDGFTTAAFQPDGKTFLTIMTAPSGK